MVIDRSNISIAVAIKYEVTYRSSIVLLNLIWVHSKDKVKVMQILTDNISKMVTDRVNITIKSHTTFSLPYLHLNSKCQDEIA